MPQPPITDRPETIAVIDFETTGMGPAQGARATEIGVVLLREGRIVQRYASLMHTGVWVPPFIQQLTGISNRMLANAPPAAQVMQEVAALTQGCALVAHNASFDRGFWVHEMGLAGLGDGARLGADAGGAGTGIGTAAGTVAGTEAGEAAKPPPEFGCTLLLSRRLYPEAPSHQLGALARWHGIEATGRAHRALADAEMAAGLWQRITQDVQQRYAANVPFGLLCAMQRAPKQGLGRCVERWFGAGEGPRLAAQPPSAKLLP